MTLSEIAARVKGGFVRAISAAKAHKAITIGAGVGIGALTVISLIDRRKALKVGEQLVAKLREKLGTPYIWGGRDPSVGLDCSGAVVWALRALGLKPKSYNATAEGFYKQASAVLVPQPGDLAFYGSLLEGVNHVMVYAGDGLVIGASGGGPGTQTPAAAKAQGAMVKVLPVTYRSDFRGYGRLPVVAAVGDTLVGRAIDIIGSC